MPSPIPNLQDLYNESPVKKAFPAQTVGAPSQTVAKIISELLNIAFYFAIFMAFYWLVWGAFQYITASGKKEELAKARSRITWALIGLLVVITAYLITTYAAQIFPPANKGDLPFLQPKSESQ